MPETRRSPARVSAGASTPCTAGTCVAGTLFDRRTFASEDELRAAVELSRNLAAPVVHDPPPLASADTERERRRVLLARSADARTALAADYFGGARVSIGFED